VPLVKLPPSVGGAPEIKTYFDLFDYDLPAAPILADIRVDGTPIKAVVQLTKQAFAFVFDRVTGKPVWPIEERPVPASDVPGERAARTQPFPTKPPAFDRQGVSVDDLIDFTPELRTKALQLVERYKTGNTPFIPYVAGDMNGRLLAAINIGNTGGGTNWPGAGFDPETGIAYLPASNSGATAGSVVEPPPGFSDIRYVAGTKGAAFEKREGPGFGSAADAPVRAEAPPTTSTTGTPAPPPPTLTVEGLSFLKPPYGVLSAIDLKNPDKLLFQVPHGDTPDNIKNHPLLKGMNIPKTGQSGSVGVLITKTFVAAGDPGITTVSGQRGASLRAYDKMTGAQIGEVRVPAPILGMPMTYSVNGQQFIVVGVSGGNYTGEYIAFTLPASERPRK